jgi:adenylate kinase
MNINVDDIIQALPAERQAKITALAKKKIKEALAHTITPTERTPRTEKSFDAALPQISKES